MKTLLTYFIQSMDEIQKDGNIDLVIFTGDLVDKGGCSFGNIDTAFKEFEKVVITPIIEKLKLPKEGFVFIPAITIQKMMQKKHRENRHYQDVFFK